MKQITWKQVIAFFVAMGSISHLTATVVEAYGDAHMSITCKAESK